MRVTHSIAKCVFCAAAEQAAKTARQAAKREARAARRAHEAAKAAMQQSQPKRVLYL